MAASLTDTPLISNLTDKLESKLNFVMLSTAEIAQRMVELIEEAKYPGGTALGVYHPGDATIVATGDSLLEELGPSDMSYVRSTLKSVDGIEVAKDLQKGF